VPVRGTIDVQVGDAGNKDFWFDRHTQGDDATDFFLKEEVFTTTLDTIPYYRDSTEISFGLSDDPINWVIVTVSDSEGLPCGRISLDRDHSGKVSPKDVAVAIDRFIKTRQE